MSEAACKKRVRREYLSEHPICENCGEVSSTMAMRHKDNRGKLSHPSQAVCGSCHSCIAQGLPTLDPTTRRKKRAFRQFRTNTPYSCKMRGDTESSLSIDHIIPKIVRPDLTHDVKNFQFLCKSCHAIKTNNELIIYAHWYAKERELEVLPYEDL